MPDLCPDHARTLARLADLAHHLDADDLDRLTRDIGGQCPRCLRLPEAEHLGRERT